MVLASASAIAGLKNPIGGGSSQTAVIGIPISPVSEDIILAQFFLLNGTTKEILWFGQVTSQNNFAQDHAIEQVAQQAAMQIPSAFLTKPKKE